MVRYRFRPAARDDLEDIWDYTLHEWSIEQAISYTDELENAIELICDSPTMCRERIEYDPPVRIHLHGEHLIVYVVNDDEIIVIRILHSAMDVDSQLSEKDKGFQ